MSRKNVVKSYKMFSDADISSSATSDITSIINLDKASIAVSWTGTAPVGVLTVEVRNGEKEDWRTLNMGAQIDITGASGSHDLIFNELPFTDMRLVYTATSGTGTMNAVITAKVVGA